MRRALYGLGGLLGVGLLVGGVLLAVTGYTDTGGPADAVRGYFAALADGDAPHALAYGDVPDGPTALLSADVLRAQQRTAPLRQLTVVDTRRLGSTASVAVRYVLAYPDHPQTIDSDVALHRRGRSWRLDAVAVRTSLHLDAATDRATTVVGTRLPQDETLVFPGAVPVGFDTPYLQLDPVADSVALGAATATTDVIVDVSPAGRTAAMRAVQAALQSCLRGGDVTCPLPSDRYVPGTLRGSLATPLTSSQLTVTLDQAAAGALVLTGKVTVDASYTRLTFVNQQVAAHGDLSLSFRARAYPVRPLRPYWTAP